MFNEGSSVALISSQVSVWSFWNVVDINIKRYRIIFTALGNPCKKWSVRGKFLSIKDRERAVAMVKAYEV